MRDKKRVSQVLALGMLIVLVVPILGACASATPVRTSQPTQTIEEEQATRPTEEPSAQPEPTPEPLADALRALDAVLAYLAPTLGDQVPKAGVGWNMQRTTPEGLVGAEAYELSAGDWIVTLSYPIVLRELTVFTINLANRSTGYSWEGQVDSSLRITETSASGEGPILVLLPTQARDVALAYLRDNLDVDLPATLNWVETRTTAEGLLGSESYEYTSGDWVIEVVFPVTAPAAVVFSIVVSNPSTGFKWEVNVDPTGEVTEFAPEESQGSVKPSSTAGEPDLSQLARDNSAFALDLYQALREKKDGNLFFSPHSISLALAMTYAGARGETESQMAEAMRWTISQAQLHPSFRALSAELAARGEGAKGKDEKGFRLNIVNALWGQAGYAFLPAYLDLLAQNYGAGMERVDFAQAEQARETINRWIEKQTENRIKDLIGPNALNAMTRLVLTNAVYFNAAWAKPFVERQTREEAFTRLDGSQVRVPTMRQSEMLGYVEGKGYQAVELPYDGNELSMVVLLPGETGFEGFESVLDATQVEATLQALAPRQVTLSLPKFEFDSDFSLKDILSAMGMPLAFTTDADFSGMTGARDLFISEVLHKAFVSVDEAGTEAAAATALVVGVTSMPSEPVEVKVDRPFLFLIRDLETGSVLFLGRVLDPTE